MKEESILMTGGHAATTAIATIYEIKKRHPEWKLFWVGTKSAVEGKYVPTLASRALPNMGVKFIPITTGRLQRQFTIWTIPSLLKIPIGIFQAFRIILTVKPKVIVSFGGYASVPVCFSGFLLRIPIIIHEQTVAVGLANKINAYFATTIAIARQESKKYFRKETVLVGNPVSSAIANLTVKKRIGSPPTIYVTGGSSGAQRINKVIEEALYELLKEYRVIHQTGKLDYERLKEKKSVFPSDLKEKYEVYDIIDPTEIADIYERSDIIISRAGANTVSEIMVARRPAILIPIPWTSHDEQTKNAQMVEKTGLGVVLTEKELTAENLLTKIKYIRENWNKMVEKSDPSLSQLDRRAAGNFTNEIEKLLK